MKNKKAMLKIKIAPLSKKLVNKVAALMKKCFPAINRYPHSPHNWNGIPFTGKFIESRTLAKKDFDPNGSFVCLEKQRVIGFALAVIGKGIEPKTGFLETLAVDPRSRRQGIGTSLLAKAESYFTKNGVRKISLAGEMIGGMPVNEDSIPFMFNRGYRSYEYGLLQSMTQDTTQFVLDPSIPALRQKLEANGVTIRFLEQNQIDKTEQYLRIIFPDWAGGVATYLKDVQGAKMLIALRGEDIVGHAGPYSITESVYGNFNSIGIKKEERGNGLGLVLFQLMCAELKSMGAQSTSLTVGQASRAREIYQKAGYRVRYVMDYKITKDLVL